MSDQATRQLTEAIWGLTNELAHHRPPTEPPTKAAPVTPGEIEVGDWVRVTGPDDDPLIGKVGRVRSISLGAALVDFPTMQLASFHLGYLEPAPKPDDPTPRH